MATVSVIIPVYNTEAYLEECLQSLQNQSYGDFEAIIIDDGSTDGSAKIIEQFTQKDSRFKKIPHSSKISNGSKNSKGPAEARNIGLDEAQGDWICFVDSDDKISEDFLKNMLASAEKNNADMVCSSVEFFGEQSRKYSLEDGVVTGADACQTMLYQKVFPDYSLWNKLFAAKLWQNLRFGSLQIGEDLETVPLATLKCEQVALCKSAVYFYRKHGQSILSTAYSPEKTKLLDAAEKIHGMFCATHGSVVSEGATTGASDDDFEASHNTATGAFNDAVKASQKAAVDASLKKASQKVAVDASLKKAAQNILLSVSFSILMRTPDEQEFADARNRAWRHIKDLRTSALFDTHVRYKNKVASIASFVGYQFLSAFLKRFG